MKRKKLAEKAAAKLIQMIKESGWFDDEKIAAYIESLLTAQAEGCVQEWVIYGGGIDAANAIRDADPDEVTP